MLGAEDRGDLRQFDFTDTGEVVDDLLLFVLELCLVGQNLPFASSANPEMLASCLASNWAGLNDTQHTAFHERVFFLRHLYIDDVARYAVGYKDHHAFVTWYF